MRIIIPMAGLGTRFQKVSDQNPEYKKPKPFINIKNWPMVRWATGSLPFFHHKEKQNKKSKIKIQPENITFIILKEHNNLFNMESVLKTIYHSNVNVIILDKVTRGATETAYKARHLLDPEDSLLITDSDHFFDGKILEETIHNKDYDTAGIIPVFQARNEGIPKWSYSLLKPGTNYIEKVAEKDRTLMEAGAYANIGAYYFSKAKHFLDLAEEVINKGQTFGEPEKAEFYIAPLYQILIDRGMKVEAAIIPQVWGLGTPNDLDYFLENFKGIRPYY